MVIPRFWLVAWSQHALVVGLWYPLSAFVWWWFIRLKNNLLVPYWMVLYILICEWMKRRRIKSINQSIDFLFCFLLSFVVGAKKLFHLWIYYIFWHLYDERTARCMIILATVLMWTSIIHKIYYFDFVFSQRKKEINFPRTIIYYYDWFKLCHFHTYERIIEILYQP